MITHLISWSLKNRFLVLMAYLLITGWGIYEMFQTPVDAIPDLSENQVIVLTEWPGRSPQEIEDQVVYPLSTSLQGLPGVKVVRAQSSFGFGMLTVIFEDKIDVYFARSRILERLDSLPFKLPEGVTPVLGPDATGLGWVYQYYLDDTEAREKGQSIDLGELRAWQDWFVRYQLNSVPGVAEIASIGGFVRQYQIDVDPSKLRAFNLPLKDVLETVSRSNNNVGGGNIEINGRELILRGLGLVQSIQDLQMLPIGYFQGQPVLLRQVATVGMGPEPRRGALDCAGREVVGGIVVMRYGVSTLDVIQRVKAKMVEVQKGLPPGIKLKPFYDRSELIHRAIHTLRITLLEEILLVTLAHIIFLAHFRSIAIVTVPLPLSILMAFIFMHQFGITSNIMSLSGLAVAIGVLVDAGVVVTEAVMREAHAAQEGRIPGLQYPRDMIAIVQRATNLVARPIFYAMTIIILAFLPVFALTGQEGKLFHPLAFTKTFAMLSATILAMTLVPVLASLFIRGHLRGEDQNPVMRFLLALYLPLLKLALRFRKTVIFLAIVLLAVAIGLASQLGYQFMTPLNERAFLFMPITVPGVSVPEVNRVMAAQDKAISQLPEVESVVGKFGRAETATDPAPVSMVETTVTLRPVDQWRSGTTMDSLKAEIIGIASRFPGFQPSILQPIENRVLMLNTGIRGQVAVKIFGDDLVKLEEIGKQIEAIMRTIPGAADVYAERVAGAPYLDMEIRREDAARYGVSIDNIFAVIETALGGKTLTTTIEGRRRFPVRVRYARELRDTPESLKNVLVPSMSGVQIPLAQVVNFKLVEGPSMISSENGLLRVFVQSNVQGRDLGGFVDEAKRVIAEKIKLPPGYYISWEGQYEHLIRARQTFMFVIPVVLFIIFILLYITYGSAVEAGHVLLAVPFALSGGLILQYLLGYDFSVAVWVGYIALFGTAVQTAVVMVIYLEEAVERKKSQAGRELTIDELKEAIIEGAALRLRPKVMTVSTIVASLAVIMIPTFSGERTGIEVMRPIAVPVIGGMISSLLHILLITPAIFLMLRMRKLKNSNPL
jgi:copper/silver efflux system protein